jgi:cell division protein ZapA (FtsZ GTPase activity inhibitor)
MNALKKYKVSLLGEPYMLVSDEPEEHLLLSAQRVDDLMKHIAERSGISDLKRIAVLASLQLANQIQHLEMLLEQHEQKELNLLTLIDSAFEPTAKKAQEFSSSV